MTEQEMFRQYFNNFVNNANNRNDEFEVRFGTKGASLSKIDFDNIAQKILSSGFQLEERDNYSLKIFSEYLDPNTGKTRTSNIRTEIHGMHAIQKYCKTNSINGDGFYTRSIDFLQKKRKIIDNVLLKPIDFSDYNFRVSYQEENIMDRSSQFVQSLIKNWDNSKKTFRLLKRCSYVHPDYPFRIDLSIVKSSKVNYKNFPISSYSFKESGLVEQLENYEVEIEALNQKVRTTSLPDLKKIIKIILAGIQQSNFPIKRSEETSILNEYKKIVFTEKPPERGLQPKHFIGLSSISLEMENLKSYEDENVPSILKNYSVTDKADGLRKLLYVSKIGKIYLINMNMNVQFTGLVSKNKEYFESILDGEHVTEDKLGNYINLFLLFDVYFINKKDMRSLPLYNDSEENRLFILHKFYKNFKPDSFLDSVHKRELMKIEEKEFLISSEKSSIFEQCKLIMQKDADGLFDYEIDGLIFTPIHKGVGIKAGDKPINRKITWTESFKWKPSKYNTVDFLVTTQKDQNGQDVIHNIFEDGISNEMTKQLTQYKTLVLRVGFDENKHGFLNPCQDIINDTFETSKDKDNNKNYKPVPFYPTNPYIEKANLCNLILKENVFGDKIMFTENGKEIIDDNTIVEFRYDGNREFGFNWIPIRVRYDKTREYKKGLPNYGNAYHVAQSVWRSIHNPITTNMITTGENIPIDTTNLEVYYNRKGTKSNTRGLRDFHNMFIKRKLINSTTNNGDILIDTSVGKAGDLYKWIHAKLAFILGLDISQDNIENKLDGACARYIKARQKTKNMPKALFLQGNSMLNIKNGSACYSDKGRKIIDALFERGPKDMKLLGKGVYKNFGIAKDGFNVVSTQFALHYFFENKETVNAFLRNVSECCKVGGYFIGTCYDGKKIFRMLQGKQEGESVSKHKNDQKIWEVEKLYDHSKFEDNETSLGYAINVYQESINKKFKEYLVNFNYLTILLENYGFVRITDSEAREIGLPHSVSSFSDYFNAMENEVEKDKDFKNSIGSALSMSPEEKFVSFLNNCFVFKKIRNVDTANVEKILTQESTIEINSEDKESKKLQKDSSIVKPKKPRTRKLKRKIKLVLKDNEDEN